MTYVYRDPTPERIVAVLADWPEMADEPLTVAADEIARTLIDKDVAVAEYEGCSSELEMAYVEYEQQARDELERRKRAASYRRRNESAAGRAAHNRRLHEGGR